MDYLVSKKSSSVWFNDYYSSYGPRDFRRSFDTTCHTVKEGLLVLAFPGFVSISFPDVVQLAPVVWGKGNMYYFGPDKASRYGNVHHCLLWVTSNSCSSCVTQFYSFQKCCYSLSQWKMLYVTHDYHIDITHLKILPLSRRWQRHEEKMIIA